MSTDKPIDFGLGFDEPGLVECSIFEMVPAGPNFLERLARNLSFTCAEELIILGRQQFRYLRILPIVPIQTFAEHEKPHLYMEHIWPRRVHHSVARFRLQGGEWETQLFPTECADRTTTNKHKRRCPR